MSTVLREVRGNVGILTLNRPRRLNAWTGQMQTELYDGLQAFEADEAVRVIVVTVSVCFTSSLSAAGCNFDPV
jgi:enoyl-CoA hydratase